jgi:hypothetical protein
LLQAKALVKSGDCQQRPHVDTRCQWDSTFCEDIRQAMSTLPERNEQSEGDLLLGFFQFYACEFPYQKSVVCPRLGKPLPKTDQSHRSSTWTEWRFSIQDPFELSHDLGGVIYSREGQHDIIQAMQRAAIVLQPSRPNSDSLLYEPRSPSYTAASQVRTLGDSPSVPAQAWIGLQILQGWGRCVQLEADHSRLTDPLSRLLQVTPCAPIVRWCSNCSGVDHSSHACPVESWDAQPGDTCTRPVHLKFSYRHNFVYNIVLMTLNRGVYDGCRCANWRHSRSRSG